MKMLYVFTEEPSAKIVMDSLLPKVLPEGVGFKVFPHCTLPRLILKMLIKLLTPISSCAKLIETYFFIID
jgi:hypothetical protein